MRRWVIRKRSLVYGSMAYIYIPIIIFIFGWTKLPIAIICTAAAVYGVICLLKDYNVRGDYKGQELRISPWILIISILFLLVVGYYAGWGRFVSQAGD